MLSAAAMCLAMNIYYEARGEVISGKVIVANVTMTRADHQKNNVCAAVTAPAQFSWTEGNVKVVHRGKRVIRTINKSMIPPNSPAWEQSKMVAELALKGVLPDLSDGATNYHATYVSPKWAGRMEKVGRLGGHVLYKSNISKQQRLGTQIAMN
jgi:N-acetylmuramoyl-L-alanine amidase